MSGVPPPPPPSLPPLQLLPTLQTCSMNHTTYIKEFPRNEDSDSLIHEVVAQGQLDVLRDLLSTNDVTEFVNQRDRLGCTPLRLAASAGYPDCLRLLLSHGADVHLTDIKAQTPLAAAVKQNNPECVRILLESGADPDGDEHNLCTPLCWAVLQNSADIVQMLLDYGCDVNGVHPLSTNTSTFSPLHTAITYGHKQIFRALLRAGANACSCQGDGKPLYQLAVEKHGSDPEWIHDLYDHGVAISTTDDGGWISSAGASSSLLETLYRLVSEPRHLMSACRIYIRAYLAEMRRLKDIKELPLPDPLVNYLLYQ